MSAGLRGLCQTSGTVGKYGAWTEHATCGNDRCFAHRMTSDTIQGKYFEFQWKGIITAGYTAEELGKLRRVANGMG